MNSALRFLLFLRKLISFSRKLWNRSTLRLQYIFALVRSRISSQGSKKRDEIHRTAEYRPPKPLTTVICASRLPPPSISTDGGGIVYETHENHGDKNLGVDGNLLESRPISRSPDSVSRHHEPESIHVVQPPRQEDQASPVIHSQPPSQYPYRPVCQRSVSRPPSAHLVHHHSIPTTQH